jgi:hypothetical protein
VHVVTEPGTRLVPVDGTADTAGAALSAAARLRFRVGNGTRPDRDEAVFPHSGELTWTHHIVKEDEPGARRLRALVSPQALPAPPRLGSWEFRLAQDNGDPERLDSPREIPETEDGPWHVVVDEDGEWWVLQGTPPYLAVDTLDAMDRHPGAVYSTPMDGRSMEDDSADPHNGEQ